MKRVFTLRGYRKTRPRPAVCDQCGGVIIPGEMYYRGFHLFLCLGCYTINDNCTSENDDIYIPSTDRINEEVKEEKWPNILELSF